MRGLQGGTKDILMSYASVKGSNAEEHFKVSAFDAALDTAIVQVTQVSGHARAAWRFGFLRPQEL